MKSLTLILIYLTTVNSLYFYLDGNEQKCFIEELPKETTVIGTYKSEEWNENTRVYADNPKTGIQIVVEEAQTKHRIVNQKGASAGKFTFTSTESGDHTICLSTNSTGWFQNTRTKLHLDLMFGDAQHTAGLDSNTKEVLDELTKKIRSLNEKITIIKREQVYQREREREFRDTSESTNARVVNWTLIQVFVL
ncbi:emp24p/erv25p- protein, partial [Clydaea vesicula]